MIFAGNPVQSFDRYTLDEKSTTFYQIEKFFRQIALKVFLYQNLIYFLSGFHCFYYSSDAKNHFIFFHLSSHYVSIIHEHYPMPQPSKRNHSAYERFPRSSLFPIT